MISHAARTSGGRARRARRALRCVRVISKQRKRIVYFIFDFKTPLLNHYSPSRGSLARTGVLASRQGARSASSTGLCKLNKRHLNIFRNTIIFLEILTGDARPRFFESYDSLNHYALLEEQVRRARSDDGRL